jgi:phosphoribosylformimino-5-aminoimidazole carboxamide ribotide isomerase
VVTDRWQRFSSLQVDASTLDKLAACCDEFLVHGVDVEGMQLGIDEELVRLLGAASPVPVTYAGGARTLVRNLWHLVCHANKDSWAALFVP